ncbi:restriction endonuclease subunit S [Pseudoalteromonas marina]|uniref:restriction endonuclease subunit S n=1 Tax=Pseudoalteromonas marina TaxID=267375 RepID=UPI0035C823B9
MIQQDVSPPLRFSKFKEDWDQVLFGSFITSRVEYPKLDCNFPLYSLTIENGVTPKSARYERSHLVKSGEKAYKVVYPGDFVSNPMNLRFGAIAKHHGTEKVLVSKYYDVFHLDSSVITNFVEMYFSTHRTLGFYNSLATGTLDEKKRVHFSDFVTFKRLFPSIDEQQKIADFISAVDKKISLLKEKHSLLEQYKKGVMQKLFSQEIRFKDENGNDFPDWEKGILGDLSNKISNKNKDESVTNVLTNSAKSGIVSQTDYFKKDIANQSNLGGYSIVEKDDFVYNPRISELAPVGPIKRNHIGQGVMSPLYTVFRFRDENVLDYLELYFTTTQWHRYMKSIANFGARHDRMNITMGDFFNLPIPVPSKGEMEKIVGFIKSLNKKVDLVAEQLNQTKTFKKGLLQQMFV